MAIPRVFISSTYYDLRYVRDEIGEFIKSLGYEAVMHDKGGVTYSQSQPIEQSCYDELATCDIVVCIIGNKYGTQSSGSDYSITMEELLNAVKQKKKIYIFISSDVYIENNIYTENKASGVFVPRYADNIKIHEFISQIKENIRNNPIQPFNSAFDIIDVLKKQFAGLFQHLLTQEASMTESKTLYDLQTISQKINDLLVSFSEGENDFFQKFNGTYFANNRTLFFLKQKLGMDKSGFFTDSQEGLDEFLKLFGFNQIDYIPYPPYVYERVLNNYKYTLTLDSNIFEKDGKLKMFYSSTEVEKYINWEESEIDCDIPF